MFSGGQTGEVNIFYMQKNKRFSTTIIYYFFLHLFPKISKSFTGFISFSLKRFICYNYQYHNYLPKIATQRHTTANELL